MTTLKNASSNNLNDENNIIISKAVDDVPSRTYASRQKPAKYVQNEIDRMIKVFGEKVE